LGEQWLLVLVQDFGCDVAVGLLEGDLAVDFAGYEDAALIHLWRFSAANHEVVHFNHDQGCPIWVKQAAEYWMASRGLWVVNW
jgi:hypothetical protein